MNGSPVVKKIPANKKDRYLLKTGIYVRVSSGKVEQLRSLSAQASALTRYVYFREKQKENQRMRVWRAEI